MSQSTAAKAAETDEGGGVENDPVEERARRMGWKPEAEFKGVAGTWLPADEFVRRGEDDLVILRRRSRQQERIILDMQKGQDEMRAVLASTSDMVRTATETAYQRAKRELETEKDALIQAGDVQGVRRVEAEAAALAAPPPKPAAAAAAAAQPAAGGGIDPVGEEWVQRNPWFMADAALKDQAIVVHGQVYRANPDMELADQLEETARRMNLMFPDRVRSLPRPGAARKPAAPAPDDEGGEIEPPENQRRRAPAAVSASSSAPAAQRVRPRTFAAMPENVKQEFARWNRQLKGKGAPLTEKEWADTYWAQFEDGT